MTTEKLDQLISEIKGEKVLTAQQILDSITIKEVN